MPKLELDWIAVTALMVSSLALVATFAQLTAQCFATVDGYRKCQPSVMGPWGKRTRLRWRWAEFRFETLFSVPKIVFNLPLRPSDGGDKTQTGATMTTMMMPAFCPSAELLQWRPAATAAAPHKIHNDWNGELVGWVYILHYLLQHDVSARRQIRARQQQAPASALSPASSFSSHDMSFLRCPGVEIMSQSWDFVPSDVVRPLAFTTVAAIAVVARRLGLAWKQFEPYEGVFRAEGNHQVVSSTVVRGIGTILQYSRDPVMDADADAQAHIRRTSPVLMADDLGFGKLGRGGIFNTQQLHLQVGCLADVVGTLPSLFQDPTHADVVVSVLRTQCEKGDKDWMTPANDIVAFLTPFLGVSIVERPIIPWPNTSSPGPMASLGSARAFEEQLCILIDQRKSDNAHAYAILAHYRSLLSTAVTRSVWDYCPPRSIADDMNGLCAQDTKRVHDVFADMERRLAESSVVVVGRYRHLMAQHLLATLRPQTTLGDVGPAPATDGERMRRLFAALPDIAAGVLRGWDDGEVAVGSSLDGDLVARPSAETVQDAWLCMVLRAMCWYKLHVVVPGSVAPPLMGQFCESKLPLYIG
ncbi:hypothetical protein MBLNU459_g7648t1 [Dothideomycetes sp. NU459]